MLGKLLFGAAGSDSFLANAAMTLVRVFAGIGLMLGHGIEKMPPSERFFGFVANAGFPAPKFFGWAAALSEVVGGACLALGLFTRVSSFFVAVTMFVAAFVVNYGEGFEKQELGLVYLAVALLFLLKGSGDWSLDAFIRDIVDDTQERN